jgi:hypothetical protein
MVADLSKMPEIRHQTELRDTGQDGLQGFRKPLLEPLPMSSSAGLRLITIFVRRRTDATWRVHGPLKGSRTARLHAALLGHLLGQDVAIVRKSRDIRGLGI